MKRIGYLGRCSTPLCGSIEGYFCVRCRHYVIECRCGAHAGGCTCEGIDYGSWWASTGERRKIEQRLAEWESYDREDEAWREYAEEQI